MQEAVVLGLETSCDETAAAVVVDGCRVLSSRVHSQIDLHARYGGVVPELASRDHLARLLPVVHAVLADAGMDISSVDCVAATAGPGLIGALLVGVQTAKGLSAGAGIPLVGVNHLEGHLAAIRLEDEAPRPPFVGVVVSGGHSSIYLVKKGRPPEYELLGRTLDDAAGEAFDKVARLLGLPYPGGKAIEEMSSGGDPGAVAFPRAMRGRGPNLSFSGLKTSVRQHVEINGVPTGRELSDLCASVQEAIVESLVEKSLDAVKRAGLDQLLLSGGVAANGRLRRLMEERARESSVRVFMPSMALCTDNAAMIAAAGFDYFMSGEIAGQDLEPDPGWRLG